MHPTLHRRPSRKKGRYIYYGQFRDEDGNRETAVSKGMTNRAAASSWARKQIAEGRIGGALTRSFTPTQKAGSCGTSAITLSESGTAVAIPACMPTTSEVS